MADTAITLTTMTMGSVTADVLTTAEGGTQVTTGNIAVITTNGENRNVILSVYGSGGASSITVQAGDNPPAQRAGLGATSAITIPASDCVLLCLEGARFGQDNGTIRITNSGANTIVVGAYRLPDTI